jgi:diguanylate cyclase (GGDEF)-like protein
LLLPEISGENGMVVAEKIRRAVESQRFKNERKQPNRQLTISLGVAQNSTNVKNHLEMFNQADAALYRAKLEGRNRCVFAK